MGSQNLKNTQDTNVAVHTVSNIMKNMMGSDAESEVGALFTITRKRNLYALSFMGWSTHNQKKL